MSFASTNLNIQEFLVPINDTNKGKVFVLWPCSGLEVREFILKNFEFDVGERDAWEGICYSSQEFDDKIGQPSTVIAIRNWDLNLRDDPERGASHHLSVLAHESFHAAEWMIKQTGGVHTIGQASENWDCSEDIAHLLQRIMRRALNCMMNDKEAAIPK